MVIFNYIIFLIFFYLYYFLKLETNNFLLKKNSPHILFGITKVKGGPYTLFLFGSVVAVAFQITFRVEMHANDIFLFFKNYF
jgi:hypothetical protein